MFQAALVAAVMNIAIPINLGEIINVMTRFMVNGSTNNFTTEMQKPVLNILGYYIVQVTVKNIYRMLSDDTLVIGF